MLVTLINSHERNHIMNNKLNFDEAKKSDLKKWRAKLVFLLFLVRGNPVMRM